MPCALAHPRRGIRGRSTHHSVPTANISSSPRSTRMRVRVAGECAPVSAYCSGYMVLTAYSAEPRADLVCHWEDSDAVAQEVFANVRCPISFPFPSPFTPPPPPIFSRGARRYASCTVYTDTHLRPLRLRGRLSRTRLVPASPAGVSASSRIWSRSR